MRVCLAAGGTGGHLLPGVAVAKELSSRGHRVHFIVRTDRTSQPFLAKEGFASSAFLFSGFPREISLRLFTYPFQAAAAYLSARRILRRERPDAVLGMGGYISVPVGLAASRLGIPLVIHEQNSRAGLANKLLSKRAKRIGVSFEDTEDLRAGDGTVHYTGLPLRPDLAPRDPAEARRELGLDPQAPTLLIFGGSQGARALNRLAVSALAKLPPEWQVIHLAGEKDFSSVEAAYKTPGRRAFVKPFWSDMATLYSAADFVVGRSGANTVMELARMGKRALLVPFPYATDNHQEKNARYLEKRGNAQVILEKDLTEDRLVGLLKSLPPAAALREETRRRLENVPAQLTVAAARLADLVEEAL